MKIASVGLGLLIGLWMLVHGGKAFLLALAGDPFVLADLEQGRWALAFVVVPGCPACEQVISWLGRAAEAFPEIRFVLVVPRSTMELEKVVGARFTVVIDQGGRLGAGLGVERAPTVVLAVEGTYVDRLDWPFTEGFLLRKLAESLLIQFPNPRELLGQLAPDFSATDLKGRTMTLSDLPRPLLLVFFHPHCPRCWAALPKLHEVSQDVNIGLLIFIDEAGLAQEHWAQLDKFVAEAGNRGVQVLLVEGFQLLAAYRVAKFPTYFLVDAKGLVRWVEEKALLPQEVWEALTGGDP